MTDINSIQIKNIGKQLINYLNYLPVHKLTKCRLEKIIIRNSAYLNLDKVNIIYTIAKLCKAHEESCRSKDKRRQHKALQSVIWNTYFHWDNHYIPPTKSDLSASSKHMKKLYEYPPYLRPLLRTSGTTLHTYNELLNNWPLEYHYDILYSNQNSKKVTTLRNMWLHGHPNAVQDSLLHVSNHKHHHNHDDINMNPMEIERKKLDYCKMIEPILSQCYFLNNSLWRNENKKLKPIIPIVEIPFNVKGDIISKNRIINLIKVKLKTLTLILTKQWPALYDEQCIEEMLTILQLSNTDNSTNTSISRDILRLYERTFQNRMYRITAGTVTTNQDGSVRTDLFQQQQKIQFERI